MMKSKTKKPWGVVIAMLVTLLCASYLLYFLMIYKEKGLSGLFEPEKPSVVKEDTSSSSSSSNYMLLYSIPHQKALNNYHNLLFLGHPYEQSARKQS